ncbi:hypothetical protein [uncultured Prevotella sp.]|uniref:hypothetical protein n=1 Tax=uncultured Prevotella sp. TaxID=159272 RepID=UPI002583D95B|nr:hypothetical protein [uncultured Prevotella sp.]
MPRKKSHTVIVAAPERAMFANHGNGNGMTRLETVLATSRQTASSTNRETTTTTNRKLHYRKSRRY